MHAMKPRELSMGEMELGEWHQWTEQHTEQSSE